MESLHKTWFQEENERVVTPTLNEANSSWPTLGESNEQPRKKKERSSSASVLPVTKKLTNDGLNETTGHRKTRSNRGVPLPPQEQEKFFRASNPVPSGGSTAPRKTSEVARDRPDREQNGFRHRRYYLLVFIFLLLRPEVYSQARFHHCSHNVCALWAFLPGFSFFLEDQLARLFGS